MSESNTQPTKQAPAHEIRIGSIKAVIWANPTKNGVFHNVVPLRIYRGENNEWHETHSLGRDELLLAAKVLDAAHTWIVEAERRPAAPSTQDVQ